MSKNPDSTLCAVLPTEYIAPDASLAIFTSPEAPRAENRCGCVARAQPEQNKPGYVDFYVDPVSGQKPEIV